MVTTTPYARAYTFHNCYCWSCWDPREVPVELGRHLLRAALRGIGDGSDVAPALRVWWPSGHKRARGAAPAPVVRISQEQRRAHERSWLRQQLLRMGQHFHSL